MTRWYISVLLILPWLVQGFAIVKPRAPPVFENIQEDDYVCLDYKDCGEKGLIYWNALHTNLLDPKAADRSDGLQLFKTYYGPETFDIMEIEDYPDLLQAMIDRDMPLDNLDVWEVNSFDPGNHIRNQDLAYCNAFNTNTGIIVAKGNYRTSDSNKKQNQLPWSELVYQTWQIAAAEAYKLVAEGDDRPPGGPISNLRAVVQSVVANDGTQAVVRKAYEANSWVPGHDNEWREWTEASAGPFFLSMIGTDNVKGTVYILKDHAVEIGRKDISSIWTIWSGTLDIWYALDDQRPGTNSVLFSTRPELIFGCRLPDEQLGSCSHSELRGQQLSFPASSKRTSNVPALERRAFDAEIERIKEARDGITSELLKP
ncbi:MAG: hypothetical protein Q9213_006014 [Squamulea squamosa]